LWNNGLDNHIPYEYVLIFGEDYNNYRDELKIAINEKIVIGPDLLFGDDVDGAISFMEAWDTKHDFILNRKVAGL
jgi:hypothetical protein